MSAWDPNEIRRVHELQQRSKWRVGNTTAEQRVEKLGRLREVLLSRADDVDEALHRDLRRTKEKFADGFTGAGTELGGVLAEIDGIIAHLAEWMEPQAVPVSYPGTEAFVQYEARGQVLLYGPWNYPFLLTFQPLAAIIGAGNVAIVKPNELAPATSALAAEIIRAAFSEDEVAVFEGGVDLANALSELPVDHVFFTGSPAVGKVVMAAAAKHLASVTLELGGKCPAVIDGTTDLDAAAQALMIGKMSNAGQICLAPDHVYVKRALRDDFVDRFMGAVQDRVYNGDEINLDRFSRIVDERNFDRVAGYIDDAVERGAKLIGSGRRDRETLTVEPCVLLDVPEDAAVMQDEIFGPVLPVFAYDELGEVIDGIRSRTKPLTMHVFTADPEAEARVLAETSSGGVSINGWAGNYLEPNLPFGGANHSGIGAYHSIHGFRELSHARAVAKRPIVQD
ncbi:aldehyde dehydrogenase family protein [Brevibacterium sp.]|uniref:aldehyde dehydrogenase family protein n=1 Tax=Brevibacterium sp. TaxID=1701 RepID=UPI0025C1F5A0|nr:aldehyde dehydrogenase family protein [Brevibacterium sp.]